MRTGLFLLAGFLMLAASVVLGKLFSANFPGATTLSTAAFAPCGWRWSARTCG